MSVTTAQLWTRLEIVQASSESVTENGAKYGKFRDTSSGKQFTTIDATVLFIQEYGVYFGSNKLGDTPRCQTLNRIIPAPFVTDPISKNCLTCPRSQWVNGQRPDCREKRVLFLLDNKTLTPYDMVLPGTSVSATNQFKARIDGQILRSGLRGQRLKMWDFKVTLALIAGKKGGNYREIDYRNIVQRKDAGQNEALTEFAQLALPQPKAA
jgi:hypothetical protein